MSRGRGAAVALAAVVWGLPAAAPGERPEIHYMLQCQGCHLADGSGSAGSVPDLRERLALFLTVPGGREYLIRVPGSAQSPLDDAELAALLDWMLHRFGPARVAEAQPPIRPEEVTRHRRPPLTDVEAVRAELLERIATARPHG